MSLGGANVVHNKLATLFGGPSILGMCMGFMFEKFIFDWDEFFVSKRLPKLHLQKLLSTYLSIWIF